MVDGVCGALDVVENKSVVVFRCGKCGTRIYSVLKSNEISVKCFCDNSEALHGNEIKGVCILSVDDAIERFTGAIYVVANMDHYDNMINQLKNRGIKASNIITFRNV